MSESIQVRHPRFAFESGLDPVVLPGRPEEAFALVALSLLLPYLEPYLIRSMNAARPHLKDARIAHDLAQFNAQEGQHYRQHRRFNEAVRLSGFPRLPELEAALEADYQRFTRSRSLRFNLAYAEGFEAFTGALARFTLDHDRLAGMAPAVRALFEWHLAEELEHRTVAFDVYQEVVGDWVYRSGVGLYAQVHFVGFILRTAEYMLSAAPEVVAAAGGVEGRRRRDRALLRLAGRHLLPRVLETYLPWYSPHRIAFPARARELLRRWADDRAPASGGG